MLDNVDTGQLANLEDYEKNKFIAQLFKNT